MEEDGQLGLGLRDGLDHDSHHVMPRSRLRFFQAIREMAVAVFHSWPASRWAQVESLGRRIVGHWLRLSDWLMTCICKPDSCRALPRSVG
jgi:hypothetical protein